MSKLKIPAVALAALAAFALGILAASGWFRRELPALQGGVLLPQPRMLSDFRLTDQDGQPFTGARLRGHWTLLFLGFTHCPDVCPTTLTLMKTLEQRLAAEGRTLQLLFVSADPQRDTPAQLKSYVAYFSPTIVAATAAPEELTRFTSELSLAYVKVPGARDDEYTIDHSAALVLLDPDGRVAGYFQPPHRLDVLAADLARVVPVRS